MLDNITELSAEGSQLVAEVFANTGVSGDALNAASEKWRRNGLDIALGDLGFPGRATTWRPTCSSRAGSRCARR